MLPARLALVTGHWFCKHVTYMCHICIRSMLLEDSRDLCRMCMTKILKGGSIELRMASSLVFQVSVC